MKVGEDRKMKHKSFLLISTEFRQSKFVGIKMKIHLIEEGYMWVPKTRDFAEVPSEEFEKSKVWGLGSVHEAS